MLAATFQSVMSTVGYILLGLLALMFMVVIHELGHYLAGKVLGFKINEFGIGFGPAIFKRVNKKNGEVFSIRPIPLGGFCSFEGEDDAENTSPGAFEKQAPWKRLIVLFSGAFFNLISGWILIVIFFSCYGQILPQVMYVHSDSPNALVLEEGDVFLKVDGKVVNVLLQEDATAALAEAGDSAEIIVLRDGKRQKLTIQKTTCVSGSYDENGNFIPEIDEATGEYKTYYGFGFTSGLGAVKLPFGLALGRSFSFMFFLVYKILAILGSLITGKLALSSVGGPVTTITVMAEAASGGMQTLSYVVCLVSANLAVMNLLPLPALDGSRMVFCLIEWIFKKPINKKVEAVIHAVGFVALLLFAIFVDIFRFATT